MVGVEDHHLALLADHLNDPARALALSEKFMRAVVAELDNAWQLTGAEIDQALHDDPKTKRVRSSLVKTHQDIGTFMGRLSKKQKYGIAKGGQRYGLGTWIIDSTGGNNP